MRLLFTSLAVTRRRFLDLRSRQCVHAARELRPLGETESAESSLDYARHEGTTRLLAAIGGMRWPALRGDANAPAGCAGPWEVIAAGAGGREKTAVGPAR